MIDSVQSYEMEASLDEFSSIYELDKMTAKQDKMKMQIHYFSSFLLLLIIVLIIIIIYYRKSAIKNKALYKKIHEHIMESQVITEGDKMSEYIVKIEKAIIDAGIYRGVNVSRKLVADQLSVTEKYVNEVIRDKKDMNYGEYLNDIKLQYACRKIIENPADTLEAIAYESGFNSRITFFRVFIDSYGISPSEFKRVGLANASE